MTIRETQEPTSEGSNENSRRHPRTRVSCSVVWDHTGKAASEGKILDISPAGLFLATDAELPSSLKLGDIVWGQFDILGDAFPFSAVVRWRGLSPSHGRDGVGLEFTDLSQIPLEQLREFVAVHSIAPPKF